METTCATERAHDASPCRVVAGRAPEDIRRLARERMGFDELRPGQLESVESVLAGHDTLCVMSTGSGKSAIYQLAGMLLPGPAVVVSPLIALQRDQGHRLRSHSP